MKDLDLRAKLAEFKATLDPKLEYQDGIQVSDQELAEQWISKFLDWLEAERQTTPEAPASIP